MPQNLTQNTTQKMVYQDITKTNKSKILHLHHTVHLRDKSNKSFVQFTHLFRIVKHFTNQLEQSIPHNLPLIFGKKNSLKIVWTQCFKGTHLQIQLWTSWKKIFIEFYNMLLQKIWIWNPHAIIILDHIHFMSPPFNDGCAMEKFGIRVTQL